MPATDASCGAIGLKVEASLMPSHLSAGAGGRQRNGPIGALAYGMPENDHKSPRHTPRSLPGPISTTPLMGGSR